eukprot:gnl/TRDRNA2_/TRDRNA2_36907_c0_seq2.p1 gnl/TRDRNA2_/TRDRNA2_36907_c0~~gnl/TRDRNA2_/TRDRNA2_36907_c0_seq2.p1  ORF type:complete len:654 (-),score=124.37 gnl/TRDRNA2_/TRDRNA2_36907_c0_seq2:67-2028(-)
MDELSAKVGSTNQRVPVSELTALFEDPGWAEVYAATCCDSGEQLSLEQGRSFHDAVVAQNPITTADRLNLRCLRIGATAISCIAVQFKDRPYTRVDLGNNLLGDHAVLSVRSLIRALPEMRWLGLCGNIIGPDGARELAEELEGNSSLECLVLGEQDIGASVRGFRPNAIGDDGLEVLLRSVLRNPSAALTSLVLCRTSLGSEAGKHLAAFLADHKLMQHLDVSSNPLTSEGVCAFLPECARLHMLSLADTGCRGELIHSRLCGLLQKASNLAHLSLAHNPLETRPLRRMSRFLAGCESLVSLDLWDTALDTEGATALADAMLAAPVRTLTELDLSDNQLSQPEAATALAHAIAGSGVLQVLRLNRNSLGDDGVCELADALDPANADSVLQHLELCSCRIGTAGAQYLFACLANGNETLRVLRLADNFLDANLDVSLIDRLTNVHEVQLTGNRLSHSAVQKAGQICARNRQRYRDEEPSLLRAEMHRLLFQETKLEHARVQVADDEAEIDTRTVATEQAIGELKSLRASEAETQRHLQKRIAQEEALLQERLLALAETEKSLADAVLHYQNQAKESRLKLEEREQELLQLQLESEQVEKQLEKRRFDHPREVARVHQQIEEAEQQTMRLSQTAHDMRQQLKSLQGASLIDFQP